MYFMETNQQILLRLWKNYHENYQNIVDDYKKLRSEAKEKGIKHKSISEKLIREDFPKIEILGLKTREEAELYIDSLNSKEVDHIIAEINALDNECYVYVTLKNNIYDLKYKIDHIGMDKQKYRFGMNPDARR